MTRLCLTTPTFILLTLIAMLGLLSTADSVAQGVASILSGRVTNPKGEPIAGVSVGLAMLRSETDSEGWFTLNNIPPRQVQLYIHSASLKIRAIKFGKVSIYYHGSGSRDAVTFAIKPGTNIKNVEVITEYQLKIQGRIIFKNGEPLVDTSLKIKIDGLPLDGTRSFAYNRSLQTDTDGNFVHSVYSPGIYALSINYRGLSAESDPFLLEEGKPHETLVLTLNGNSVDLSEPPPEEPEKQERYRPPNVSDVPGMWIINPANKHAYKWIECENRNDAQVQAAEQGAHLVTITSEEEQIWLEAVFGTGPYWIGISDAAIEGKWVWETGEPVTYTNWKKYEDDQLRLISEPSDFLKPFGLKDKDQRRNEEMEDYAIMSGRNWEEEIGKWQTADSTGAPGNRKPWMAILEKEGD